MRFTSEKKRSTSQLVGDRARAHCKITCKWGKRMGCRIMGLQNSKTDNPFFKRPFSMIKALTFPFRLDPLMGVDPVMLLCQEICPLCAQILQRGVPETAPLFAVGVGGGKRKGSRTSGACKDYTSPTFKQHIHSRPDQQPKPPPLYHAVVHCCTQGDPKQFPCLAGWSRTTSFP